MNLVNESLTMTRNYMSSGVWKDVTRTIANKNGTIIPSFQVGSEYFVDSGSGSVTNSGLNWSEALLTIDAAINKCTASSGDVIWVAPGHAETISVAAGMDFDIAGITVIGLGTGSDRPTISFTATASDIDIDAANTYIENIYFDLTGIDAVVSAIDVGAADFTMINCEFLMADGTGQATNAITTAAAASRMKIIGCTFKSPNAGANEAINLTGATDGVTVADCDIYGDFVVAPIHNPTGNIATNVRIEHNYLQNDQTGDFALELVSAVTGLIKDNMLVTDAIATALDAGSCTCIGNRYFDSSDTDKDGTTIPTAVGTGGTNLVGIAAQITVVDGLLDVPTQDLATDVTFNQVVGKKSDTVGGTSIVALVKQVLAQSNRTTAKSTAATPVTQALFTVAGGAVRITGIVGHITTAIAAGANTTKLIHTSTGGAAVDLCATLDIASAGIRKILSITGVAATAMKLSAAEGVAVAAETLADYIVLTPGEITMNCSAGSTGVIDWFIEYEPLSSTSTIVSA